MSFITQEGNNTKYFLIIIILILVIGGGIIYWQGKIINEIGEFSTINKPQEENVLPTDTSKTDTSQAENETADWKTYKNEKYGFEIKYPKNWQIESISKESAVFSPLGEDSSAESSKRITIEIKSQGWVEEQTSLGMLEDKKEIIIGVGNYSGIEALNLGMLAYRSIILKQNSVVYDISTSENNPEMSIFNQMLSTFRFLD